MIYLAENEMGRDAKAIGFPSRMMFTKVSEVGLKVMYPTKLQG